VIRLAFRRASCSQRQPGTWRRLVWPPSGVTMRVMPPGCLPELQLLCSLGHARGASRACRRRQVASRSRGQCVFQGTVHPRFEQFNVMWGAPRCLDLASDLRDLSVARLFFESARASTYAWQRVCVRKCAARVCFLEWRTIARSRRGRGTTSPGGAGRTSVLRRTVGGLLALERLFRPANPLLWISFTPRRCARA